MLDFVSTCIEWFQKVISDVLLKPVSSCSADEIIDRWSPLTGQRRSMAKFGSKSRPLRCSLFLSALTEPSLGGCRGRTYFHRGSDFDGSQPATCTVVWHSLRVHSFVCSSFSRGAVLCVGWYFSPSLDILCEWRDIGAIGPSNRCMDPTSFQRPALTLASCINIQPCPHTLIDLVLCGQAGSSLLSRQRSRGVNNGNAGNSML